MLWHYLTGAYIDGYDIIEVLHTDARMIQGIQKEMIGMVLQEHSAKKSVISSVIARPQDELEALITRSTHMFREHASSLIDLFSGEYEYDEFKAYERLLDSTLLYCVRHINKYERGPTAHRYFLLCMTIEHAADILKDIARNRNHEDNIAVLAADITATYANYLLAKDFEGLYVSLRSVRDDIGKQTFLEGLLYSFVETLYNNSEYLLRN
jgi:hypothetical protein